MVGYKRLSTIMVRKEISSINNTYYFNEQNQLHKEDGPAIQYTNGDKEWWINGLLHRIDGPAIAYGYRRKEYYLLNKEYSYEDWLAIKDYPLLW